MIRVLTCVLVLSVACAREDVRSPAAATSTAAPSGDTVATPSPTATPVEVEPEVAPVEPAQPDAPTLTVVDLAPDAGELSEQLATAASRARADGRVPVVEMWASWCAPCKKLDKLMGDPEFVASLSGITLLRLDSDAWGEALDEAGFTARTIPSFYVVDAGGRPRGEPLSGSKWGPLDGGAIAAQLRGLAQL